MRRKTSHTRGRTIALGLFFASAWYAAFLVSKANLTVLRTPGGEEREPGVPPVELLRQESARESGREQRGGPAADRSLALPNAGRSKEGDMGVDIDSGSRSIHYGETQRRHQEWLKNRIRELAGEKESPPRPALEIGVAGGGEENRNEGLVAERVRLLERGVRLWNATYVPPIEPVQRKKLIDKWSGNGAHSKTVDQASVGEGSDEGTAGRILFTAGTFDRGGSTQAFNGRDKFDFILMMMDEMREACEAGFSPQVHLIAAWKISEVEVFLRDRMFCRRTGQHVPLSLEEHPTSITARLSNKHRVYMKTRVEDFDIFIQSEDDMITTVNHILMYEEESEILDNRRDTDGALIPNNEVPGFIRVEPLGGDADTPTEAGSPEEKVWFQWEIILSRFLAAKLQGAGTYFTLGPSVAVKAGNNNQGIWMATQEQLRRLDETCNYLKRYGEKSNSAAPEYLNGGLQMFSPACGFKKVFPARRFESFLIHHRSNNKLNRKLSGAESSPGVPISLVRDWAEQFLRDESFLKPQLNVA